MLSPGAAWAEETPDTSKNKVAENIEDILMMILGIGIFTSELRGIALLYQAN